MEYEAQLKLQAYLDGELPEGEAREVANLLARDPGAAALLKELRQTREALSVVGESIPCPESREFFWSKIQRQIERELPAEPRREPAPSFLAKLRRLLVPAAGVALLAIAAMVALQNSGSGPGVTTETALADSGAVIYHDYSAKATFVWLSYPAEKEVADDDEMGTLE